MGNKHTVRFEPVGIEIEVDEDQTILRAASEQGIMLMHGCKEGQCAACKSFILDGEDVEHDSYSTFALPDMDKDEGYTLLCRAHPYEDLTIELLNYDEEMIRSGQPIREVSAEVVSNEPVTGDLRHLVLRLEPDANLAFFPGQYVDIETPAGDHVRSFSMANTHADSVETGCLEFVIRMYPGGAFSESLRSELSPGVSLRLSGPFGVFTLRDGRESDLVFVGGGAGLAPILSVLRSLAEKGSTRRTRFYYGARRAADLCFSEELERIGSKLTDFAYIPAVSEPGDLTWDGESGLITDVVQRHEHDLEEVDAYVCGPPPMVEAAMQTLTDLGVPEKHIYYDKFTTTGSSEAAITLTPHEVLS